MNEQSLEQLLHETPEPPMQVDLDHILHQGRTRQRRHRMAALGSIAAALVIAVAVAFGAQSGTTSSITPARHTTTAKTSGFFVPDTGLKANQVLKPAFGKQSMWMTQQVLTVVRTDGSLSVRRKGSSTPLPVRSSINGVLGRASIVDNGKGSILLTPVQADTTSIDLDSNTVDSRSAHGVTLSDGSRVAVVFTGNQISPASMHGWFWGTSDGGYEYSTGQRASTASIGSTHVFYFPGQKILGLSTADGSPLNWGRAPVGEFLSRGEDNTGKGQPMKWSYVSLLPRSAHGIHANLPSSYHSQWTPVARSANLPGTPLQIVAMSLTSKDSKPTGTLAITWIDHRGDTHTVR